ncbi:CvpA family protein [Fusobacterium sp.]|uniref:CvpA family protein n=1 Tax=Fusobacterium sp. TaxID=68766 RepID=UPI0025C40AFC|nr:CvpA family protein [Fusobacterium sp.]
MYLDIVILVVLVLAILDGLKNGLFVEFLSAFGLIINFVLAKYLTPILIDFLKLPANEKNYFLIYIVMFWAVYIVVGIFIHILRKIMEGISRGFIIRILGGIIGGIKGIILGFVIIFIFNFSIEFLPEIKIYGKNSKSVEVFLKMSPLIENHIPKVFKKKLDNLKNDKLIDRYINKIL